MRELREPSPEEHFRPTPDWLPRAAGGKGTPPPNPNRSIDELGCWDEIHEGCLDGSLLPHEAALHFGIYGSTITEFLSQIEGLTIPACPGWVPKWARTTKISGQAPAWSLWEKQSLIHYWNLALFSRSMIATLLQKPEPEIQMAAEWFGLPEKTETPYEWNALDWSFTEEGDNDPKEMSSDLQHKVAEASATRFAMLYERLHDLDLPGLEAQPSITAERKTIERELDKIFILHTRIFEKYVGSRARKYTQCSPNQTLTIDDLEQAGRTAIFERLRRWHPNRQINFSRNSVDVAITREMIACLESQRLIALPDKVRSYARKLKAARDNGTFQEEMEKLSEEGGKKCVEEAAKHENSYAFVATVPLMDVFSENEAESHGVQAYSAECKESYQAYHQDDNAKSDVVDLIFEAASRLNEFERRAVLAYHGFDEAGCAIGRKTLEEIGEVEGVTKERIRQRIAKGMERMKKWLATKDIRSVKDALAL